MSGKEGIGGWVRGHAASLGFYGYALFAAPPLARALREGMADSEPMWIPGILLLAVLLAEPVGLYWKMRFLRRRNHDKSFDPQGPMLGMFSAVGIAHVIVTMFLGLLVLDGWGAMGSGVEEPPAWGAGVLVLLILKEFAGLMAAGGQSVSRESSGHWKEGAADILLWAYGAVAYTAWWQVIVDMEEVGGAPFSQRLAMVPVLGGLFLFFYLPMRLPFLLEEYLCNSARGRRVRLGMELAIGVFLGLYPAFA
jgi:hypothetical protein